MTTDLKQLEIFEDEPDCGVDAAYKRYLRKKPTGRIRLPDLVGGTVGPKTGIAIQLAPIHLEEYLL